MDVDHPKSLKLSVACRVRPLLPGEAGEGVEHAGGGTDITLTETRVGARGAVTEKPHSYTFQHVHVGDDNQQVFDRTVAPIVNLTLSGEHSACFAYGYTGTGKSTTIYGLQDQGPNWGGVAAMAAQRLVGELGKGGAEYGLRVSMCEVYGKECRDLLADGIPLKVRTGTGGRVYVRQENGGALTRKVVRDARELDEVLAFGTASRRVGSSTVHDASSRSHAVIEFDVVTDDICKYEVKIEEAEQAVVVESNKRDKELGEKMKKAYEEEGPEALAPHTELGKLAQMHGQQHTDLSEIVDRARDTLQAAIDAANPMVRGRLAFIDMAGNDWEQAADVQTTLARAEQAAINSSLLAVKECLQAVAKKAARVPYRNSTLTHLMQRYFTPDANLLMFATITPSNDTRLLRQSVNTLNYAGLVGGQKGKPHAPLC